MIVLTGAAGFIGSQVARRLAERNSLLLVDKPEHFRERKYFRPDFASPMDYARGIMPVEKHRILDRSYFPKVLEKITPDEKQLTLPGDPIEAVIHLGACTNTAETRKDFLDEWNVHYSQHLWKWCTRHKVPLIYASSGATFGNGEEGFSDSWDVVPRLKPMNPYGQSKQDFDLWVWEQIQAGETPPNWYGLKFFNVYGPWEGHKGRMASAVLHSYRSILSTGECPLFRSHNHACKDGEQSRDFIFVDDIVNIIEFLLAKRPASRLYNCGTGQARTFRDLVKAIFAQLELPEKISWIDTPPQFRKAYQYFTQAEMGALKAAGYSKDFIGLETGVGSYVDWLQGLNMETPATFH